jgi:AcrR family transcriptional regulator
MVEKKRILESAIDTFTALGIKRVSIDDICLNLSISKKTFYFHYHEKQTLINDFIEAEFAKVFDEYDRLRRTLKSPLEVMIRYNQFLMDHVRSRNPSVLYDLKQFYPENYAVYNLHRVKLVDRFEEILKAGTVSGDFRKELDPRSLAELRVSQLESILLPHPIIHERPEAYHQQLFEHYIYGIAGFLGMGKFPDTSLN